MTIKLNSIARWRPAQEKVLTFEGHGARRIRLHVNSPGTTLAWLVHDKGELQFLARVDGFQTIEFHAEGNVSISLDGNDVWWSCAETEPTHVEIVDPHIFTKIANRRHRNPELEEIEYRMMMNMERRLASQQAEFEEALARRRKEIADGPPANEVKTNAPGAAANAGSGEVSPQEPTAAEPSASASGEDGGEQSSG